MPGNTFYVGQTDFIEKLNDLADTLGSPGPPGTQIYSAAGSPSNGVGVNGDFYIDTSTFDFYGPKTGGVWGSPLVNLAAGTALTFLGPWDDTSQPPHTLVWHVGAVFASTVSVDPGDPEPGANLFRGQPTQQWLADTVPVEQSFDEATSGQTGLQARAVLEFGSLSKVLIFAVNLTNTGTITFHFATPGASPVPLFNGYLYGQGNVLLGNQLNSFQYPGATPFDFVCAGLANGVYFLVVEAPADTGAINVTATASAGGVIGSEITNKWAVIVPSTPEYLDIFRGRLTAFSVNYIDYQVPTDGFSYTALDGTRHLLLDPAGALTTGEVVMPPNPTDAYVLSISSTEQIATATFTPNTGQAIKGAPTALGPGATSFVYRLADTTWYPT